MCLGYLLATDNSMANQGSGVALFSGYSLLLYTALAAGCFWARKPVAYRISLGFAIPLAILGVSNILITKILLPTYFLFNKDLLWGIVSLMLLPVVVLFSRYLIKQLSKSAA